MKRYYVYVIGASMDYDVIEATDKLTAKITFQLNRNITIPLHDIRADLMAAVTERESFFNTEAI